MIIYGGSNVLFEYIFNLHCQLGIDRNDSYLFIGYRYIRCDPTYILSNLNLRKSINIKNIYLTFIVQCKL